MFRWDGNLWQQKVILQAGDEDKENSFGSALSLSGELAIVGVPKEDDNGETSGSAYLFDLSSVPDITISANNIQTLLMQEPKITETLTIENTSNEAISWEMTSDAAWLDANPVMGTVIAGEQQLVTITINTVSLSRKRPQSR